jgi:hypothetical protein
MIHATAALPTIRSLIDLPEDVLVQIMAYLDVPDIIFASQVGPSAYRPDNVISTSMSLRRPVP